MAEEADQDMAEAQEEADLSSEQDEDIEENIDQVTPSPNRYLVENPYIFKPKGKASWYKEAGESHWPPAKSYAQMRNWNFKFLTDQNDNDPSYSAAHTFREAPGVRSAISFEIFSINGVRHVASHAHHYVLQVEMTDLSAREEGIQTFLLMGRVNSKILGGACVNPPVEDEYSHVHKDEIAYNYEHFYLDEVPRNDKIEREDPPFEIVSPTIVRCEVKLINTLKQTPDVLHLHLHEHFVKARYRSKAAADVNEP
ncbi:hypothetical protein O6H91_16G068800 [Diphasiastrum complanatum]|uniref:Uncharacterized protein n=1 Tax=Diphasiastrum complanatum TaxID=34168 RepID=A0ACC2BE71_DIPCM|nr:hypothetical protein O6H91_16G068800 [Diphasiastrum complanatum]